MANECVGLCVCPVCHADGAEVREGIKKSRYIVCDNCCSQIRTMSRLGRQEIDALTRPHGTAVPPTKDKGEAAPAPVPAPAPAAAPASPPTPKPAPKKGSSWLTAPLTP